MVTKSHAIFEKVAPPNKPAADAKREVQKAGEYNAAQQKT